MTGQLPLPSAKESEVADAIDALPESLRGIVDALKLERDVYKGMLVEIAKHSVCCDARHQADKALKMFY